MHAAGARFPGREMGKDAAGAISALRNALKMLTQRSAPRRRWASWAKRPSRRSRPVAALLQDPETTPRWRRPKNALADRPGGRQERVDPRGSADEQGPGRAAAGKRTSGRDGRAGRGEYLPALVRAVHDADAEVRTACAAALGKVGPGTKAADQALGELLTDREGGVRVAAAERLWRSSPSRRAPDRADPDGVLAGGQNGCSDPGG